jgi:hypothetical protein
MFTELVRGVQDNASASQVQRVAFMVVRRRSSLCEENVAPLYIDPKDENKKELEANFKPRARNRVR